jgi:hypothetical protein
MEELSSDDIQMLCGYFSYHHDIQPSIVHAMLGNPGLIPDGIIVEFGVDHEDHNELALYIDDLARYSGEEVAEVEENSTAEVFEESSEDDIKVEEPEESSVDTFLASLQE